MLSVKRSRSISLAVTISNKFVEFIGIAGDTANSLANKLKSPSPPVAARKPAFIDAFLYKMKKNPELLKNKATILSGETYVLTDQRDLSLARS